MTARMKLNAALLAALAAAAAPAFAATEEVTSAYVSPAPDEYYVPQATTYYDATTGTYYTAPPAGYYVAPSSDYYAAPSTEYYVAPSTVYYEEPPIVVTAPGANSDVLINDDVVTSIASDPRIEGRIGSDTFNGNVTLNGRVGTPIQAELAARDARSVDGVNDVENRIRPVVGE
jgi:hypothetical protein